MYRYKITVATPTYNRAYILPQLYHSLQKQSFRDFEWLVIDDGSTDNTEVLISQFITENNDFPIRYYKKQNGGKCRALNYALPLAEGELFFMMDSDDYLSPDALEKIAFIESTIKRDPTICGVSGNRGLSPTNTPNKIVPAPYMDINTLERYKGNDYVLGEHAEAVYTDIMKQFPFPEFEGEKFITEGIVWNRLGAAGYKLRYFPDIIWIYEYRDDGLTNNIRKLFLANPYGAGLSLHEQLQFTNASLPHRFRAHYSFYCEAVEKYTYYEIAKFLDVSPIYMKGIDLLYKFKRLISGTKN